MPKGIIWFLVGVGMLFFLSGLIFRGTTSLVLGILMSAGGLGLGLMPGGILRKEEVFDTWSALIENRQGKADNILQETKEFIEGSKAPNLRIARQQLSPGIIRSVVGDRRDFPVVVDQANMRLSPYQIHLNARDYGVNLAVDWHLTCRPDSLRVLLSLIPFVETVPRSLSNLDLFDQQDLRAYATNCHHCLMKSVEKLMVELHQDPAKFDRKSRGFLGIS